MSQQGLAPEGRKEYIIKILRIFIPITLQNLLSCSAGIIDTAMVGKMGEKELAAVGAASMVAIVMFNLVYGFGTGIGAFISQFWGLRDIKNIRATMGIIYKTMGGIALCFTAIAYICPSKIIWLIDRDPEVIKYGVQYLHVIAPSYALAAISFSIIMACRCVQHLKVTTIIDIIAVFINTFFNYCLIFGKLGFPQWGVRGAALATVLCRIFEFTALLIFINCRKDFPLRATFKELNDYDSEFFMRVVKTAIPSAITDTLWGITTSVYLVVYGLIGTAAVAAYQVINLVGEASQAVFYGLANATSVTLGEQLGQGQVKRAKKSASQFLIASVVMSLVMSLVMLKINKGILNFYDFEAETMLLLEKGLVVNAAMILGRMMPYILMCGILRSGGDNKIPMYQDVGCNWLITIPAMFICVLFFKGSLPETLVCCYGGELLKGVVLYFRYRKGVWANVLTDAEIAD